MVGKNAKASSASRPKTGALPVTAQWYKNPLLYFAGFSAAAAITSAIVAWGQHKITQMQYTPQLALSIDFPRIIGDAGEYGTIIHVKNVGSITIYNAEVSAAAQILPIGREQQIWGFLEKPDQGVTMGPTEAESLGITLPSPRSLQIANSSPPGAVLMVVGKISYVDELHRPHVRYACAKFSTVDGQHRSPYCETPTQN